MKQYFRVEFDATIVAESWGDRLKNRGSRSRAQVNLQAGNPKTRADEARVLSARALAVHCLSVARLKASRSPWLRLDVRCKCVKIDDVA
jgi:hypothetical protein